MENPCTLCIFVLLNSVAAVLSGRGLAHLRRAERASLAVPEDHLMYLKSVLLVLRNEIQLDGLIRSARYLLDLDLASNGVDILAPRLNTDHCSAISVSGG